MLVEKINIINPERLDERLRAIEEGIKALSGNMDKHPRDEWLTLEEFKKATGIKSHYSINKMKVTAKEKKNEFRSKILGKKLFIHESEVKRFFDGFFE